ncbi:MAG: tetratricopeptide repeat protein [Bdellovibrionales bacterium]
MKKLLKVKLTNLLKGSIVFSVLLGCSIRSENYELEKAQKAFEKSDYSEARDYFYKFLKRNEENQSSVQAAKQLFQISSIHLPDKTLMENSLKHIILRSLDKDERMDAQFKLGKFYYEQATDYDRAINHFSKFALLSKNEVKNIEAKLFVARSYFYKNNFYQAEVELQDIVKEENPYIFEAKLLQSNIFQNQKRYKEAVESYRYLLQYYPERSNEEQLYLGLSLSLEENKDYKGAYELLNSLPEKEKESPFIMEKLARIRYLIKQQPGARGKMK